ncbi:MAG: RNA-binding protein [Myxococcales bacterium]|nr:RNA-binding protein [Myxococcales bacterium]
MSPSGRSSSCTLYVGGFGSSLAASDLRELFARHGSVRELRLVDRGDASFAYLTFDHEAEAELARRELDGLRLAGRTLRVAVAQ